MASMNHLVVALLRDYDDNFEYEDAEDFVDKWATIFEENEV